MIINDLHAIYDAVGIHRGYTVSQRAPDGCTLAPVDRQYPPLGAGQRYPDSPTSRVLLDGVSVEVFAPRDKSADEHKAEIRLARKPLLEEAISALDRDRKQVDFGLPRTLSAEQASAWAGYYQALCDLPAAYPTLKAVLWPARP